MLPTFTKHHGVILLTGIFLFCVYVWSAPADITRQHGGVDSAELAFAAATAGIAHPTGYAVFVALGWLWLHLPLGVSVIQQLYLLNHLFAVLACLVMAYYAYVWNPLPAHRLPVALFTMIFLGLNFTFWSQAVLYEVYSLHTLWLGLLFLTEYKKKRSHNQHRRFWVLMGGFIWGVSVTHHLSAILWIGALAMLWGRQLWYWRLCGTLTGLLLGYGLLWVLALAEPLADWGRIHQSPSFFLIHITGGQYHSLLEPLSATHIIRQSGLWLMRLIDDFTPLSLFLGFAGFFYGIRYQQRLMLTTLLLIVPLILFTTAYTARHTDFTYLLPVYPLIALWLSIGLIQAIHWLPLGRWILIGVVPALLVGLLATHAPRITEEDTIMRAVVRMVEDVVPQDAILLSATDEATFALWYAQAIEEVRPDVIVLDTRLSRWDWYIYDIASRYPDLPQLTYPLTTWINQEELTNRAIFSQLPLQARQGDVVQTYGEWTILLPPYP